MAEPVGKNYIVRVMDILGENKVKGDIIMGMGVVLKSQIIDVVGTKAGQLDYGHFMCYCELINGGISAFIGSDVDVSRKSLLKLTGEYTGLVTDCYDGDTITVDIDLGLNILLKDQRIRMYGINAPEMRSREDRLRAIAARDYLRGMILGKRVKLATRQCDKKCPYGRWLATVYYGETNCSAEMLAGGFAVPFMEEADP